jgi:hypothetical protein
MTISLFSDSEKKNLLQIDIKINLPIKERSWCQYKCKRIAERLGIQVRHNVYNKTFICKNSFQNDGISPCIALSFDGFGSIPRHSVFGLLGILQS